MAEGVFVRKSSGLVRQVGLIGGALYNISNTAPYIAVGQFLPYYFIWANGGDYLLALTIGLIGSLLVNSVYAHFTAAMPRSGGEYMFLGRSVNPSLGFMVNWVNMATYAFWWMSDAIFQTGLLYAFLSFVMPQESVVWMTERGGIFICGACLMVFHALLTMAGLRLYMRLQNALYVFVVAISVVVLAGFIMSIANFPSIFNQWSLQYVPNEPSMYQKIISDAAAQGFSLNPHEGPGMEQTLLMAVIFFTWQTPYTAFTTYVAGEIKKAESGYRQHFFVEVAALSQAIVFMLWGWAFLSMVGVDFIASFTFLGGEGLPLDVLYWNWPKVVLPNWVAALFVLSVFVQWWLPSINKLTAISRCAFAWSFDRVFPTKFSYVNERFKTPTYTIWGTFVVVLILLILWATAGDVIWVYIAAATFWGIINIMIVCIAGTVFPYIRKDMFEFMPLKSRLAGIPVLTIISILGLMVALWTSTAFFTNPDFVSGLGITAPTIATSIVVYGLGLLIPIIAKAYWKKKGIDLNVAFKSIPPA